MMIIDNELDFVYDPGDEDDCYESYEFDGDTWGIEYDE